MPEIKQLIMCSIEHEKDISKIQLFPAHPVTVQKKGSPTLTLTKENAERIIDRFKYSSADMPIDYEHNSHDSKTPEGGIAAGWILNLSWDDETGLWADVKWTPRAEVHIRNEEYRYISPTVGLDENGFVYSLIDAALVNKPAIDGMKPVMNKKDEEENMPLKDDLTKLLGLKADATDEDISAAVTALKNDGGGSSAVVPEDITKALSLSADVGVDTVVGTIKGMKESGDQFVKLSAEIESLKADKKKRAAEDLVNQGLQDGKITAAGREQALALAQDNLAGFEAYLKTAPVIVQMSQQAGGDEPKGKMTLSADQEGILTSLGVSKEDVEKYGQA